jgi:amino acid transporter
MAAAPAGASQETEVTFARDLGLFDATMIGIGAMIGAGIFVLTGIAAGEAGPAALLAFGLNGLVTLLTALSYAELASVYPKSGGGYSFITKAFPGPAGFASGWMLWFCVRCMRLDSAAISGNLFSAIFPPSPILSSISPVTKPRH